jgi:hypothetical protein
MQTPQLERMGGKKKDIKKKIKKHEADHLIRALLEVNQLGCTDARLPIPFRPLFRGWR